MKKLVPSVAALVLLALAGCSPAADGSNPAGSTKAQKRAFSGAYPIKVVATTGMVADLVRHVGGEHVDVVQLMGEGVDPHLYHATTDDISQLNRADAIFYSGLHLEGKMGDLFVRLARKKPTIYAVTEGIDEQRLLEVSSGLYDPHVWFDVALWSETLGVVEGALAEFDPKHAAEYKKNAEAYRAELLALDAEVKTELARIPDERRVLVTAHDAFHYFGRAYDIEVKAIQGISTDAEASVKQINELVGEIVDRGIKAVFVETSVSERNIRALVEGCQARGHRVTIGGELYSDAMGKPGTPEGTYVGMVRKNVATIAKALE
ncbi:MAG: zinc ABC transporter substrate-binding protein [Pirellulales bacterium]